MSTNIRAERRKIIPVIRMQLAALEKEISTAKGADYLAALYEREKLDPKGAVFADGLEAIWLLNEELERLKGGGRTSASEIPRSKAPGPNRSKAVPLQKTATSAEPFGLNRVIAAIAA